MADPNYDGLCGIASTFTLRDGKHLRCKYELGHAGDHEWKMHKGQFVIRGGVVRRDLRPSGCTCTALLSSEGERVDYLFSPDCKAHARK